jgi:hypothetical protein
MNAVFEDLEDDNNEKNGTRVSSERDFKLLLESFRNRHPFTFELAGDNGFTLTIGWSPSLGCVQYAPGDGQPPYWVAIGDPDADADEHVNFLAGGTQTPIPRRSCMPVEKVVQIVRHFLETGERWPDVEWEEI